MTPGELDARIERLKALQKPIHVEPVPVQTTQPVINYTSDTIGQRFEAFHNRHPEVYRQLVELARQARRADRTRLGIGMLFEVLRWQRIIDGLPDETETFKLNNDYRSRYARMIMDNNRDLAGMFEIRELKTA